MLDVTVIGGGIVGLATAFAIKQCLPDIRMCVLEKEGEWGRHQSGHNSGVIHSGIYYKPGSLKASLAVAGNRSMKRFCVDQGIPFESCGKIIVATREDQLVELAKLEHRAIANGIEVKRLSVDELIDREPHVKGISALVVPSTGIVDYVLVCNKLASLLKQAGVEIRLQTMVTGFNTDFGNSPGTGSSGSRTVIQTDSGEIHTRFYVNCAGLHSDRIAKRAGVATGMRIIPFRGEYYKLKPQRRELVRHLIYPVPDPAFPFLGLHFTRMMNGEIEAGPNAVLGFKREGYRKTDMAVRDIWDTLSYPAFWKLASKHWAYGLEEIYRSFSKAAFVQSLQELIPSIRADDLEPAEAGVRAQALRDDGFLLDDFHIVSSEAGLHVCNAPSPAATASLEIGQYVADRLIESFRL